MKWHILFYFVLSLFFLLYPLYPQSCHTHQVLCFFALRKGQKGKEMSHIQLFFCVFVFPKLKGTEVGDFSQWWKRIRDIELFHFHKAWGVTAHKVSKALTGPGEAKTQHMWVAHHSTEAGFLQGIAKVTCATQTKRDHFLYFRDFEIPGSERPSNWDWISCQPWYLVILKCFCVLVIR